MTARGKFILTIIILAVVGFGVYRWKDKLIPQANPTNPSVNPADVKRQLDAAKPPPADITSKLLAGTNAASLVDGSSIPKVAGVSD